MDTNTALFRACNELFSILLKFYYQKRDSISISFFREDIDGIPYVRIINGGYNAIYYHSDFYELFCETIPLDKNKFNEIFKYWANNTFDINIRYCYEAVYNAQAMLYIEFDDDGNVIDDSYEVEDDE